MKGKTGRIYKDAGDPSNTIKNAEELLAAVETKTLGVLKKYEDEVANNGKATESIRSEFKKSQEDFAELTKSIEDLRAQGVDMAQQLADQITQPRNEFKSLGDQVVESKSFQNFLENGGSFKAELKNTITGETASDPNGILTQAQRMPGINALAQRSLNILDVLPSGRTNSNAIEYVQHASETNAAAETAEAALKPESTETFSLVTEFIRTIPTFLKISEQALSDSAYVAGFLNARLAYLVRKRLQTQVLAGNGTAPNLSGMFNTGRFEAFAGTSGATMLDSINEGKTQVMGNDFEPNVVMINPVDLGAIERAKDTTNNYLGGTGGAIYYPGNGIGPLIWGLNVVPSNDITVGKFGVMDINAAQLVTKDDVEVKYFDQDEDNAQKNLVTIRAEGRWGLIVYDVPAIVYGDLEPI